MVAKIYRISAQHTDNALTHCKTRNTHVESTVSHGLMPPKFSKMLN